MSPSDDPSSAPVDAPALQLGFAPSPHWARYERPMRRVLEHVADHLDEPLDLNVLADIACLSPQHWHRVYHALAGETMAQTVRRLRLHRAAAQLAAGATHLGRVSAAAGHGNLQAFTRAFRAAYGVTPQRYRQEGQHRRFEVGTGKATATGQALAGHEAFEVTTLERAPECGWGLAHRGPYLDIGRAFDQLLARLAAADMDRPGLRMLALFHDDPGCVSPADLRATAVVLGAGPAPPDCGLAEVAIPSGLHARLAHTGPYASMPAAYRWLFGQWLPASGHAPGAGPVIEEYLNSPRQTAPRDLRTDLMVPIGAFPASGSGKSAPP